jgi:predicted RNase H-like HicB family nuclease
MRLVLTIKIWREGKHYIAYSPELEVASQGKTPEHALERVKEAIEGFLEETKRMGTFEEVLKSAGFLKKEKKLKAPLISLFPLEVKV